MTDSNRATLLTPCFDRRRVFLTRAMGGGKKRPLLWLAGNDKPPPLLTRTQRQMQRASTERQPALRQRYLGSSTLWWATMTKRVAAAGSFTYPRGRSPGRSRCAPRTGAPPAARRLKRRSWEGLRGLRAEHKKTRKQAPCKLVLHGGHFSNESFSLKPHLVASLKGVTCLLQEVDHELWRQEGLPMGVNDGAEREVGALSDALLQLLDTGERSFSHEQRPEELLLKRFTQMQMPTFRLSSMLWQFSVGWSIDAVLC